MPRIHLFEFEDQPWCPALLRDATTDLLSFALNLGGHYGCMVPKLSSALARCGTRDVVDLCSGGGGPWPCLINILTAEGGGKIHLTLTDSFPNHAAYERLARLAPGRVSSRAGPVDATGVPEDLKGFRTLFTAFHHFGPRDARAILLDAVRQGQGIGIFEVTQRSPQALLLMLLAVPFSLPILPFLPPWRPMRLWLIPLIPVMAIVVLWDGLVSCLRTYSPSELRALVATLPESGYDWDIGSARYWSGWSLLPITYLIGTPPVGPSFQAEPV